jgi:ribosome-associated protein
VENPEKHELTQREKLVSVIGEALLEKKGEDILRIDVSSLTSLTDVFIICSANSDMHVKALAENVERKTLEELNEKPWRSEGWENRRWIVLDYVDVVVNVFIQEAREYYALDRVWNDGRKTVIADPLLQTNA